MLTYRQLLVLGVLILLIAAIGFRTGWALAAQESAPATPGVQENSTAEVLALRAQLEEMRRNDNRLIQTVWGTLGAVTLVAGLIVAAQLYASGRSYERDRAALHQEIVSIVERQGTGLRNDLLNLFESKSATQEQRIADFERRLHEESQTSLSRTREELDESIKASIGDIRSRLKNLSGEINQAKYDNLKKEFDELMESDHFESALYTAQQLLELVPKLSFDIWETPRSLERIQKALERGAVPAAEDRTDIVTAIRSLPESEKYALEIQRTINMLHEGKRDP